MIFRFIRDISVGFRIFGLAAGILTILVAVAVGNYLYMKRVNDEISDMAHFITPIAQRVALVNMFALEQEIHFERVLRQYEIQPPDTTQIAHELRQFERYGELVDHRLEQALAISAKAVRTSVIPEDIIEFARLEPILKIFEQDHQRFQNQAQRILVLEKQHDTRLAHLLDRDFEESENVFNRRVHALLRSLERFTQHTIDQIKRHEKNLLQYNLFLTLLATVVGLFLAIVLSVRLAHPVKQLIHAARQFEQGDYTTRVNVASRNELGRLGSSFNAMVKGVEQKVHLKEAFGHYLDPRIVDLVVSQQRDSVPNPRQTVTVFHSDLAHFSSLSELLTPERLVKFINTYFTLATVPLTQNQAVIDRFIGDAIQAFWAPPFTAPAKQGKLACRAALAQFTQLALLQQELPDIVGVRRGLPQINLRIGLDTGESVVGSVGAEHAKSYTVIGNVVDRAQRLEDANKKYGTRILLSDRTAKLAGDTVVTRVIDWLPWGNNGEVAPVHELLGIAGSVSDDVLERAVLFDQGTAAWREQNTVQARQQFNACLKIDPHDTPAQFYLERCRKHDLTLHNRNF